LKEKKKKAKFYLEKDHFESRIRELQDSIEKQEKKIEGLLRDNEKLKNEKNQTKRTNSTLGGRSMIGYNSNSSIMNNNTSQITPPKDNNFNPMINLGSSYIKDTNFTLSNNQPNNYTLSNNQPNNYTLSNNQPNFSSNVKNL